MYHIEDNTLVFTWPEGDSYDQHLPEVLAGIRDGGKYSIGLRDGIHIRVPGFDQDGYVEARIPMDRRFPAAIPFLVLTEVSPDPYVLVISQVDSPYYGLRLPGLCELLDTRVLAISRNFSYVKASISRAIFNCNTAEHQYLECPAVYLPFLSLNRVTSMLSKRPRVPKTIDFEPIFTALFGKAIATAILKEIK